MTEEKKPRDFRDQSLGCQCTPQCKLLITTMDEEDNLPDEYEGSNEFHHCFRCLKKLRASEIDEDDEYFLCNKCKAMAPVCKCGCDVEPNKMRTWSLSCPACKGENSDDEVDKKDQPLAKSDKINRDIKDRDTRDIKDRIKNN